MSLNKENQGSQKGATSTDGKSSEFSKEERAAMRERTQELKAAARADKDKADGESAVLAKIDEMRGSDRAIATRIHEIIKSVAPELTPKTWYGMPAYAKDGNILCFFQSAQKFNTRYATLGFSDKAKLDDGNLWPVGFALKELTAEAADQIAVLVKKAVS